jgi:hypothetical protein
LIKILQSNIGNGDISVAVKSSNRMYIIIRRLVSVLSVLWLLNQIIKQNQQFQTEGVLTEAAYILDFYELLQSFLNWKKYWLHIIDYILVFKMCWGELELGSQTRLQLACVPNDLNVL